MVSLQTLSHVGQSHGERLNSRKWILEIQGVGIAINSTELHDLVHNSNRNYNYYYVGIIFCFKW